MQDTPGPNGGLLSARVQLVLFDVTDVQHPVTIYAGPPAGLQAVALGTLAPGNHRDYLFAATLPDSGLPGSPAAGDNLFQGSALSLGFEWRATSAASAAADAHADRAADALPPTTPTVPITPHRHADADGRSPPATRSPTRSACRPHARASAGASSRSA